MKTASLTGLRERPFELLLALESAVLGAGEQSSAGGEQSWVGVAFRLGAHRFVAARNEVREIVTWPGVTRVPRARSWLLGIANVRGQLVPVTDLAWWAGLGEARRSRSSRIILVNHPDMPAGLLVDQVVGFRRFAARDAGPYPERLPDSLAVHFMGAWSRQEEHWAVIGLHDLVESEAFMQAAS